MSIENRKYESYKQYLKHQSKKLDLGVLYSGLPLEQSQPQTIHNENLHKIAK